MSEPSKLVIDGESYHVNAGTIRNLVDAIKARNEQDDKRCEQSMQLQDNEEIKASQAAYAARPFAVRWVDSHVSCTNRFDTFAEAFAYAQDMWAMIRKEVSEQRNMESHLWQSNVQTPTGAVPLAYYLLADDVSSYYRG